VRLLQWARSTGDERVQLVDGELQPVPDPAPLLLRIAAEAVILQDQAEEVLAAVGRREHLGTVAPRGGPLVRRFFALREQLPPSCDDPQLKRLRAALDTILNHHAMQVATALEFLAVEWRSERLAQHVTAFQGLGAAAGQLEDVYEELKIRR